MGETNQHDSFYITAENLTSRSPYAFSNFDFGIYNSMEGSLNIYFASYRIDNLYTNTLKDMFKSFRFRLMRPQSAWSRVFHQILFIWYTI